MEMFFGFIFPAGKASLPKLVCLQEWSSAKETCARKAAQLWVEVSNRLVVGEAAWEMHIPISAVR